MARQYLDVPFREKDQAKALGARFDWEARRWYVEGSTNLTLFERWLPPEVQVTSADLVSPSVAPELPQVVQRKGVTLSQLLAGVARSEERRVGKGGSERDGECV